MNSNDDIIKQIETENFIWIIYLFIIVVSFIANYFETIYYKTANEKAKNKYRVLNIFVFSVAFIVYLYFFKENYNVFKNLNCLDNKNKVLFNRLNYFASLFILIAGTILLYIAIFDKDLETEIAFN